MLMCVVDLRSSISNDLSATRQGSSGLGTISNQDTLQDPRNRPDPERPARSQRPSMERPCSWPNPETTAAKNQEKQIT